MGDAGVGWIAAIIIGGIAGWLAFCCFAQRWPATQAWPPSPKPACPAQASEEPCLTPCP